MRKTINMRISVLIFVIAAVITSPPTLNAKTTFVTIGTSGITGVYYSTGGAIAKIVNKKSHEYGIHVRVESTGGSVSNINAIVAGDLEFGVVQSNRQYQAYHGTDEWSQKGPQKNLRSIFSVNPEAVTLVAADDADIKTIMDLKGKRVNIGNRRSGHQQNSIVALENVGLDYKADFRAIETKAVESSKLLQGYRIDAFFYTVGHPSGLIKKATGGKRKVRLIPIPEVDRLVQKYPYYARAIIPIKFYPKAINSKDVDTFCVKVTFVTSAKVPDSAVYSITKEVFDNLDDLKKLHPAYATLTKAKMLEGISAPFHPGALKYFKEVGLK